MNQKTLISEMSALERKVELLVSQQNSLRQELKQLREENSRLRSVNEEKDHQVSHFQKTLKLSKIVDNAVADETDTTELKRTINEYIRTIDKCIAQLSQ